MPIYVYKCESCGYVKDVLQKMSDLPLTVCPTCASASFKKQLTAAGFQLKGSGWYATDFKGGAAPASAEASGGGASAAVAPAAGTAAPAASSAAPSETTPAPLASGGCGEACACH